MKLARATLACLLTVGVCAQAAWARGGAGLAPSQQIATLFTTHSVRDRPDANSKLVERVHARGPLTRERTVLPVLAQTISKRGQFWLRVRLPGRAFGQRPPPATGWISASHTLLATTAWHIVVHLNARRVTVYNDGRPLRTYPAIVGKPSTPTPTGEYFVEENVILSAGQPGGPYALAISDRSDVLQEFDGGPGQIALHGLENLGGQLGTAESHGCIRLADSAITWLAARIKSGTPVTITP
jgi:lipoprotein-anchoring transpeptidase ErfK/SrfK